MKAIPESGRVSGGRRDKSEETVGVHIKICPQRKIQVIQYKYVGSMAEGQGNPEAKPSGHEIRHSDIDDSPRPLFNQRSDAAKRENSANVALVRKSPDAAASRTLASMQSMFHTREEKYPL